MLVSYSFRILCKSDYVRFLTNKAIDVHIFRHCGHKNMAAMLMNDKGLP